MSDKPIYARCSHGVCVLCAQHVFQVIEVAAEATTLAKIPSLTSTFCIACAQKSDANPDDGYYVGVVHWMGIANLDLSGVIAKEHIPADLKELESLFFQFPEMHVQLMSMAAKRKQNNPLKFGR